MALVGFGMYHMHAVDNAAKDGRQEGLSIGWDIYDIYEGTPTSNEPFGPYEIYLTFNKSEITNATGVSHNDDYTSMELEYTIVIPYDDNGWKEPVLMEKCCYPESCCYSEGCSEE